MSSYTEDEAKTKWCPLRPLEFTVSRRPSQAHSLCVGSACMAWRVDRRTGRQFSVEVDDNPPQIWNWDPSESVTYKGRVKVKALEPLGHCGLAGVP